MADTNERPTKPQRDAQGKFVKGNNGGPGNPFGRHLGRARCKWNSLATPEHVENVYKAVYEKAIEGCVAAMKLYLVYLLGKPNPMPNPDHVDLDEFELYEKATQMLKRSPDVMTSPDHSFALEFARTARPAIAEESWKQMQERFEETAEREKEIDEEIKQMEDEYDRQQAERGTRGEGRGARKTRRARAKRQGASVAHKPAGSQVACDSRSEASPRARNAKPFDLPNVDPEDPREPRRNEEPSPSYDGFFPYPPPSSNGFAPDSDPKATDG